MEALTYLDLAVGTYTMGVNSDDGFRVLVGSDPRDQFYAIKLGEYDGGRGAGDTTFTFTIPKNLEQNERGEVFRIRPSDAAAA